MASSLRIAALLLLALPIASGGAGDASAKPAAKPMSQRDRIALETSQRFSARMNRLDALMGGLPRNAAAPRARSADAEY